MAAVNLKKLRWDAGLTPEQLGELVGVAGQTIRRLEDGVTAPTPSTAKKIADHFDLKPSDLWPEKAAA